MSRSLLFGNLTRVMRVALYCEKHKISTSQGLEQLAALEAQVARRNASRREFLALAGASALVAAIGHSDRTQAAPKSTSGAKVAIVGAGIAGLACGYELKKKGISATLYEASSRVGGRCFSLSGYFPGQVVERGGEFIDNHHKTIIRYARQFKLTLEDVSKQPGEVFYYFNGQRYSEAAIVDEYRDLVAAMRTDLKTLSSEPTADNHTDADVLLDKINLWDYLERRKAGEVIKAALAATYQAEFGTEPYQQSCLNLLLYIHLDKRSKFTPFGASDERYHIVEGNDRIVQGLSNELKGQINLGMRLVRVRKNSMNRIELTFNNGSKTTTVAYDAVVLTLPFTVLREVELDRSLELPAWKREAIAQLGYGTNAKMMVGMNSRPWVRQGSNGSSYSNLLNHQCTWESNPVNATNSRAVIVDFSSGNRGVRLNSSKVQTETAKFLTDLDWVYQGALAAASRDNTGNFRVHLEPWPANPLMQGSYACYKPGQFTTIAGTEGKPIGKLYFAGEHTNSFYEWQGFMEGAALSGIQVAKEILQEISGD